ncbi:hypothetical protein CG740_18180 [Streptomyces sp. CB01201]|uniref:DUF4232 domain-containing protein n=1 Tax=unclassified Streptomyces TaxID=2593676 RepID=UPI000C26DD3B|nr:hypothetical protein CG740_18180 [Streptomyces sp. CB01201]
MRRPASLMAMSVLVTTALLLTACGAERAGYDSSGTGASGASSSPARVDDPGKDGVRITSLTLPPASASPTHGTSVSADDLTARPDSGIVATFEVTNSTTRALTYSVVFTFLSGDGGAMANQTATVRDVGPGKTVRGSVRAGELAPGARRVSRAKVLVVNKVPAGEAVTPAGTCPPSGIRVSADDGDAAMGLRVVGLHLDNCGKRDYAIEGYPRVELLDDDLNPVTGIAILRGSGDITTGAGPDEQPRPLTLKPGESAQASLVWRNTTESGTAANIPYVRVRAKAGSAPVTVAPHLDLGTTGRLGVRPWTKAKTGTRS